MTGLYEDMNKKRGDLYKNFDLKQLHMARTKKYDQVMSKQIKHLKHELIIDPKDIVVPKIEKPAKFSSWNFPKEMDIY